MGTQKEKTTIFKSVHIPGAKHFKIRSDKKIFIFSGITKRQFREIPNARVIGYFTNRRKQSEVSEFIGGRLFQIKKGARGRTDKLNFEVYNSSKRLHRPVCYVPVGKTDFLVYERIPIAAPMLPVSTAVAVAGVGFLVYAGYLGKPDFPTNPLNVATGVTIGGDGDEDRDIGNEMIDFAGYDEVSVTAANPYVLLQNPETNDVYFSYVVYDESGSKIMTTDLIPPGRALQWAAGNDLGSGTHSVTMHVDTFDMTDTSIPYNTMSYEDVKVHVN